MARNSHSNTNERNLPFNDSLVMSRFPGGFFDYNGSPHYYMTDYQGNNIGVFDRDGNLVLGVDYYPSGEPGLERFHHLNPYTNCAGTTVNLIDSTGKDVAVLLRDNKYLVILGRIVF